MVIGHGLQQLQHFVVGRAGLVVDGLTGVRLRADGLGLGPGAVSLAVRSGRFHLQLRLRAGTVNNLEQVHIQFMARGACCRCKIGCAPTLRAVQVLQPLQQVRLRFLAREFVATRLRGQSRSFYLLGCGRLGCHGVAQTLRTQGSLDRVHPLVGSLDHQRDGMFTLELHRAIAIAVPVRYPALGRQGHVDGELIGLAQASLHRSFNQPFALEGPDVHLQHLLVAVQHETARPGALIGQRA